jgi:hypothetical protein
MNELCYDQMDTRDRFRALVRSKDTAYLEANCSWEVLRGGNLKSENRKIGDVFNCQQRINGGIFKRIKFLDSAHQIGVCTT